MSPARESIHRMMGRRTKLALASGVVVCALVVVAVKLMPRSRGMPDTFVVGTVAIGDGDRALLLLRHNESGTSRSWAVLVDDGGKRRWTKELPGALGMAYLAINQGVSQTDDAVAVSYGGDVGSAEGGVVAFALDDGSERWRSSTVVADGFFGLLGDSKQVFQMYWGSDDKSYVRALDRSTGKTQWTREIAVDSEGWGRLSEALVWLARGNAVAHSITRADGGDVAGFTGVETMCVDTERLWYLTSSRDSKLTLGSASVQSAAKQARPIRRDTETSISPRARGICGTFEGDFIFDYGADDSTGLAGVDPETGEIAWRLSLDNFLPSGTYGALNDTAANRGALSRHLWFPATNRGSETVLVHVDLETRTLVHRSPVLGNVTWSSSFRRDGITYVTLELKDRGETRILAFDGASLTGAIAIPFRSLVHPLQAGSRNFWLSAQGTYHAFDSQGLAALDPRTLQPAFVRGDIALDDVTATTREMLGLH